MNTNSKNRSKGFWSVALLLGAILYGVDIQACTTAVVSGKYTADGRPLLFKQRDTPDLENKVVRFSDGKYPYIGIVNASDTVGNAVFAGYNTAGFAIMNSASYNLNTSDKEKDGGFDGKIMKLALQKCVTLEDFEHLLDSLPKPLRTSSNFGVIDASGGAAYYETGNYKYVKFDANDAKLAPQGYLIRTNFSYSGDRSLDKGLARFETATQALSRAAFSNSLDVNFFIRFSRNLKHGITQSDLQNTLPADKNTPEYVAFRDYVPRYLTASSIVVEGVQKTENPALTTMWTILGSPLTTVSVPLWIKSGVALPAVFTAASNGKAPLNAWSLELKKQLFPIERGEGQDYLNLTALQNQAGNGILQKIEALEAQILSKAGELQKKARNLKENNEKDLCAFYDWVDKTLTQFYAENR